MSDERHVAREPYGADLPPVVGSHLVYEGKIISLRVDEVVLKAGSTALREVVAHRGAVRAGVLGAGFAGLAIAMGSVVPGMALHALLDLMSGEASYAIFARKWGWKPRSGLTSAASSHLPALPTKSCMLSRPGD